MYVPMQFYIQLLNWRVYVFCMGNKLSMVKRLVQFFVVLLYLAIYLHTCKSDYLELKRYSLWILTVFLNSCIIFFSFVAIFTHHTNQKVPTYQFLKIKKTKSYFTIQLSFRIRIEWFRAIFWQFVFLKHLFHACFLF